VSSFDERKKEIIQRHGPWTANNVSLGASGWSMGDDRAGVAEERVARITQVVSDAAGGLDGLRVLDLGCYEGAFALELAAHGAIVHGIDVREGHIAKAELARDALGFATATFEVADVRTAAWEREVYDVVLCLGLLYHLPAAGAVALLGRISRCASRFAVIETQVALRATQTVVADGVRVRGRGYAENTAQPGASADDAESFWMTRTSLFNAIAEAGFTSAAECVMPVIPSLAAYRDHVTLLAWPAAPVEQRTHPSVKADRRWPERLPWRSHPSQGRVHGAYEKLLRRRGKGLVELFTKR
jgi:SAM-dependent methyltransferase